MDIILLAIIAFFTLIFGYYGSMVGYFCVTGRPAKIDDLIFLKKTKAYLREEKVEPTKLFKMKFAVIVQFVAFTLLAIVYFTTDGWGFALMTVFAGIYFGTNAFIAKLI
ncbi:hypothetical protein BMT55_01285 [Listeria newyorkensis]|uniref:DUF3784 domain-containing protein n=1 Tax=Listeria newyorkensis TaxID=1497681 RepID=A0ABX4XRV2_9LIST|nr:MULTISPECIES: hypothetical protein [Listeria]KGL39177.1 hypothetical protein EP56_14815 [Listeriaceae bacterium FSL A5-0209]KGL43856.1 hypothetical protein EP58_05200 [Listeria newyorkensis]KMT61667.1 hypothetical protein X559_1988 [Listeria newyorkensis]PNP95010.1 hypothetical protein BMT55_01285 [Listeria newyorkensis]RQW66397.1 hypothetical protein DUK53_11870 [Listeria sp. SHR_NRA_18]